MDVAVESPEAIVQGLVNEYGLETVRGLLDKISANAPNHATLTATNKSSPAAEIMEASSGASSSDTVPLLLLSSGILETSLDAILVTDREGKLKIANAEARQLFGLPTDQDDLTSINLSTLIGGAHQATHYLNLQHASPDSLKNVLDRMRDVKGRRYDTGVEIPVQVKVGMIPETNTFIAVCHDLTRRKSRDLAMEKETQLNKAVLDASFEAIIVADDEGQIIQVNSAMLQIFGFSKEDEIVGKNIEELVGKHAEFHRSYMKSFQERGGSSTVLETSVETPSFVSILTSWQGSKRELVARRCDGREFPCKIGIRKVPRTDFIVGFIQDITHEVHALQEAELNKSTLDCSFEAIIVAKDEGEIVKVNRAMLEMFGFASADLVVGKNLEILVGEHGAMHRAYMKKFKDRGGSSSVLGSKRELVASRCDGTEFPCKVGIRKVPGSEFIVGFIQDITHEVHAFQEAELNKSTLDSSFEAIIVAKEEGEIVKVNRAMLEIFGFASADMVVGKNLDILVGEHGAMHRTYMKKFKDRGGSSRVLGSKRELVARRYDGSEFPCKIGIRKVSGTEFIVGFIQDISNETRAVAAEASAALKQAEALREAQLNQSILESSFDAIIVTDVKGDIVKVNPAMLRIFGFQSMEDVKGKNIEILVGAEHEAAHRSYMEAFRERGAQSTVLGTKRQLVARRLDGTTFPCHIGVQKVPGDAEFMVGFIQDITHETRALELAIEKNAAEELLFNMLPREIADRLKRDPNHIADHFTQATILFADIVGFTRMSNSLTPFQVVDFLNSIFSRFDEKLDQYGLNKVKTIGDCYMVTSIPGCVDPVKSCAKMCHFAMDMIAALEIYNQEHTAAQLNMRIGVNKGPVVAGVVGTKRFLYDIWGDAVNVASRMESTGLPGKVQVTQAVIDAVSDSNEFVFEKRGSVQVKGIGEMETYFIAKRDLKKLKQYWRTLKSSICSKDARTSTAILELLQSVEQLDENDERKDKKAAKPLLAKLEEHL